METGWCQVFEGSARSLLLSSSRTEGKLWDVGAIYDRPGALWAPADTITDPLYTFDSIRSAIFHPDGRMVLPRPARSSAQLPSDLLCGKENAQRADEHVSLHVCCCRCIHCEDWCLRESVHMACGRWLELARLAGLRSLSCSTWARRRSPASPCNTRVR
jgi:hypothetical protein